MSNTLVEVRTITVPPFREEFCNVRAVKCETACLLAQSSPEELLAAQLGPLASLHHKSEYSRIKFGPNGAPATYIPISIHMPDHFRKMQGKQARQAAQQAWWPTEKRMDTDMQGSSQDLLNQWEENGPSLTRPDLSTDLQQDLLSAITSPLSPQESIEGQSTISPDYQTRLKTSESHPINISMIIPPELMQYISSRLSQSSQASPVLFDAAPSIHLHSILFQRRSTIIPPKLCPAPAAAANLHSISLPSGVLQHITKTPVFSNFLWPRSFLRAVRTPPFGGRGSLISSTNSTLSLPLPITYTDQVIRVTSNVTATRSRLSMTRATPKPLLSPSVNDSADVDKLLVNSNLRRSRTSAFAGTKASVASPLIEASDQEAAKRPTLGNLFLSSCPGKKVRLSGPVKGRSAVCRDLRQDLSRMRQSGVRCIVCCLDDDELQFLGAPWPEYSQIANNIGLDILRLPTPEGFSPLDLDIFDSHLKKLIDEYTLNGRHILVHCRGGVGRAGLVACCWILKLGLCGWIETDPRSDIITSSSPPFTDNTILTTPPAADADTPAVQIRLVSRDTLQLVERVLSVVRKQRSPKAVETFEQVKFLVDFVEYLRNKPARLAAQQDRLG